MWDMGEDCVKIHVGGELPVDKLSEVFARFSQVLDALSESHSADVRWVIAGLDYGSASALARAVPRDDEAQRRIPAMCDDYTDAARRVQDGNADRTFLLHRQMRELLVLADDAHPIVVESGRQRVVVEASVAPLALPAADGWEQDATSLGTVRGRVETLSRRKALSFSLYELTTDTPVRCFVVPGLEDTMRDVWGHIADVTGTVRRGAGTDRPLWIRRVTKVDRVDAGNPKGYLRARGAIRTDEPAEVLVRRMRDDG